jgi:hypothetical protein
MALLLAAHDNLQTRVHAVLAWVLLCSPAVRVIANSMVHRAT